jgi:hypothetical protein
MPESRILRSTTQKPQKFSLSPGTIRPLLTEKKPPPHVD